MASGPSTACAARIFCVIVPCLMTTPCMGLVTLAAWSFLPKRLPFSGALRHRDTGLGRPFARRAGDAGPDLLAGQSPGAKTATDAGLVAELGGLPKRTPS